jgi:hypothetical protein
MSYFYLLLYLLWQLVKKTIKEIAIYLMVLATLLLFLVCCLNRPKLPEQPEPTPAAEESPSYFQKYIKFLLHHNLNPKEVNPK